MARLHYNGISGTLGGSLSNSATTVTFAAALTHSGGTNVPTISGDYLPLSILDSDGNLSELVYLTAYTSGATTGTITRGQEGTTGRTHNAGDRFTHAATLTDLLTTSDVTTIAATAASNAALLTEYGQLGGAVKQLWRGAPARSTNLFTVANLYQGATLGDDTTALNKTTTTPSITLNSTTQRLASRVVLPQNDNVVTRYRVTLVISASGVTGGNPTVYIGARGNGSALTRPSGAVDTTVMTIPAGTTVTSHKTVREVDYATFSSPTTHLDISIFGPNTATAGTVTLNSVRVEQIEDTIPLMWAGWNQTIAAGAHFYVAQPIGYRADGQVMRATRDFGADNVDFTYTGMTVYPESAYQTPTSAATSYNGYFGPQNQIHIGNDNQVITVYKADNVTTELRGNTHGGETGQSGTYTTDYQAFADYGDGTGWEQITDQPWFHHCYRVKVVTNTKMTRSDQGSPFVLVTTTYILYPDGTMRVDRTNTFQQSQKLSHWYYHMTSINPATNGTSRFMGRVGSGRKVLGKTVEFVDKMPGPGGGDHTVTGTGGTIPASPTWNWSVRVTALTPYGESLPADISIPTLTTTGTTSKVTASWTAVTSPQGVSPTGFNIYFGLRGYERLAGTAAAGTTSFDITALPANNAKEMPTKNTAFTGVYGVNAINEQPQADWSAIYDPYTKSVYSLALDRDAILAHTGVTGIRATIQWASGSLAKNYWHLAMAGGDGGGMPYTVPNGTVYTDTLWFFSYLPRDLERFEDEQTVRAANVKNLGSLYPTT